MLVALRTQPGAGRGLIRLPRCSGTGLGRNRLAPPDNDSQTEAKAHTGGPAQSRRGSMRPVCAADQTALAPPAHGRGVKIGRLVGDPAQEACDFRVAGDRRAVGPYAGELDVRKMGVDHAVTDRVQRDHVTPAPAAWHRMVPFMAHADWPRT